jgi:phospholipid transport system substrate-binding protein|tara:strand:+ start:1045 stop:1641 length:597 start_codon:yes stop_codon:yes gene_type:complete
MKFLKINKIIALILTIVFLNSDVLADAKTFITNLTSDASKVLASEESKDQKMLKLINLAEENVDIDGIGRYTLGKYRKQLSDAKLDEYKSLFRKYFLKSFSSRLSEYTDPKINVIKEEIINDKYTIVSSVLEADEKRPEVKIDWRVYTINPEKPLVRDLIIEGLSLARTQREEFNSVIQNGDGNIEVLFSNLREFLEK